MRISLAGVLICLGTSVALAQYRPPWEIPAADFGGADPKNRSEWFRFEDYPADALRAREQGFVTVRFQVLPNGRVGECSVVRTSAHNRMDPVPCRLLKKRARFKP